MEEIRSGLIALFEEMFPNVKRFAKGSYNNIFEAGFEKYKYVVFGITEMCKDLTISECEEKMQELAKIIPDYALEKKNGMSKKEFEKVEVDFNMNMAVYVIPILTYTRDRSCEDMARKMIEYWNSLQITKLNLGFSSYEGIAGGFKKKLCYITTAVCESMQKPDDCYELTTLRAFRDEYLLQTEEGRKMVDEYYDLAPGIVAMINMQKNSEEIYDQIYDEYLTPCMHHIEAGEKEACSTLYKEMVRNLQKQYLYS